MQPLTMKQWAINCLAIYGAYRLVKDYVEENYGIEVVVRNKKEVINPEVIPPKDKKRWTLSVSR